MANVTTGNPWQIDTASATALTTDRKRIRQVHWRSGSGTVELQDGSGNYVWGEEWPDASAQFPIGMQVTGITVSTLTSGTLYIYFENRPKIL
jgi:hypothetical protein